MFTIDPAEIAQLQGEGDTTDAAALAPFVNQTFVNNVFDDGGGQRRDTV